MEFASRYGSHGREGAVTGGRAVAVGGGADRAVMLSIGGLVGALLPPQPVLDCDRVVTIRESGELSVRIGE